MFALISESAIERSKKWLYFLQIAWGGGIKSFDVSVPNGSASYNYTSDKPSDFGKPLGAFSVSGGGCTVISISTTAMFFKEALQNNATIRITYQTT